MIYRAIHVRINRMPLINPFRRRIDHFGERHRRKDLVRTDGLCGFGNPNIRIAIENRSYGRSMAHNFKFNPLIFFRVRSKPCGHINKLNLDFLNANACPFLTYKHFNTFIRGVGTCFGGSGVSSGNTD